MSIKAMKQALEVLQSLHFPFGTDTSKEDDAIRELNMAIAEASENGLYREGYRNGYAFGEAAEREQIAKCLEELELPHTADVIRARGQQ